MVIKGRDRTFDAEKRRRLKVYVQYLVEYIINVFSTEYICYLESELLCLAN